MQKAGFLMTRLHFVLQYETLSEDHSKLFEDYNSLASEVTNSRKELSTSEVGELP